MCGIAGIVSWFGAVAERTVRVERMVESIRARGPDGRGIWHSSRVVLGHVRLSIIDLSDFARQPMVDDSTGMVLVFNGEIYNFIELRKALELKGHVFQSKSDTEVFLRGYVEWGRAVFEKLVGMWAAVLYDPRSEELVISRDRFGIKPLYYCFSGGELIFASTPRGIISGMPSSPGINLAVARDFLVNRSVDETNQTFFNGIQSFPPASVAIVRLGEKQGGTNLPIRRYWDPASYIDHEVSGRLSFDSATQKFQEYLFDAVRIHTRSDVEVASCLSGGLDSSTIVSILARVEEGATIKKVFSADFPGFSYDESAYSSLVATKFGLDKISVSPSTENFMMDLDGLFGAQEEPFGSTGVYVQWKVFEAVASHRVKVVLDGQGADEYLGGYFSFLIPYAIEQLLRLHVKEGLNALLAYWRGGSPKHYLLSNSRSLLTRLLGWDASRVPSPLGRYLSRNMMSLPSSKCDTSKVSSIGTGDRVPPSKAMLLRYMQSSSLPALLRYEDRNSMWFSIESRVPFLDHRLVECALSLPIEFLLGYGTTKRVLRAAAVGITPNEVICRKDKIGFGNPEAIWVSSILASGQLNDLLKTTFAKEFFDTGLVFNLIRNGVSRVDPNFIWRIYCLLRWANESSIKR
jgi:asparagine synthase (glutamine-hydrolysing)